MLMSAFMNYWKNADWVARSMQNKGAKVVEHWYHGFIRLTENSSHLKIL